MKIILFLASLLFSSLLFAQPDYSGAYGYTRNPPTNTGNDKQATGAKGDLVLVKMNGNMYRFWLDINAGWPSYHTGETDGTITIVNDTASFDNTFSGATAPCILKFRVIENKIAVSSASSYYNCGFEENISAEAEYIKLKEQPVFNAAWLRKEYYDAPTFIVSSSKTELFADESFMHPFAPKQYILQGEKILGITETKDAWYTEQFLPDGRLKYGWVKKKDLKKSGND